MTVSERVSIGRELQAEAAQVGIRQGAIARRLGWNDDKLSNVLRGKVPMPDGFMQSFREALSACIVAAALEIQAEAEEYRAQQLAVADRLLARANAQDRAELAEAR